MSVPRFTLYTGDESDSKLFSKRYGYFVRAIDKADGEVDCFQATAIVSSDEHSRLDKRGRHDGDAHCAME